MLLVGFVLFSTILGLRFLREANTRETIRIIYRRLKKEKAEADTRGTSRIIYIRLKKEKVVREWEGERERE